MRQALCTACMVLSLGYAACAGSGNEPLDMTPDADGFITAPLGFKYKVVRQGEGPKPTTRNRVLMHYLCKREDGTVIDSSYARGQPEVHGLLDLVRGFREALLLMPVGSHFEVIVPGWLGYGSEGIEGVVGRNETLTFNIELYSIVEG